MLAPWRLFLVSSRVHYNFFDAPTVRQIVKHFRHSPAVVITGMFDSEREPQILVAAEWSGKSG
jgi:hypothetical protein